MNRQESTEIPAILGIPILILLIPVLLITAVIVVPVIAISSLITEHRKRKFLRPYRGKTILFCTGGKFYQKFVERNRQQLQVMLNEVIHIDDHSTVNRREINWHTFINVQEGFPILVYVKGKAKTANIKKDFFLHGRDSDDTYFLEVLSTSINKLKSNKTVL